MNCEGYRKLLAAVEYDEKNHPRFHDYRAKLAWAVDRAKHYAEKTGLTAEEVLDAWERDRRYWYMNYYQEANQPLIDGKSVRVFATIPDFRASLGSRFFRCPACNGVTPHAYECKAGTVRDGKTCDWKVYGFFRDLGKGVTVVVKDRMIVERIFMPLAWEWPNDEVKL